MLLLFFSFHHLYFQYEISTGSEYFLFDWIVVVSGGNEACFYLENKVWFKPIFKKKINGGAKRIKNPVASNFEEICKLMLPSTGDYWQKHELLSSPLYSPEIQARGKYEAIII